MGKVVKKDQYLKEFAEMENVEFQKTWEELGDHSKWISEVFVLIQKFEIEVFSKLSYKWRPIVFLIQLIFKEIHLCFFSLMRKQTAQAYGNFRIAIEAAGFINAIKDDPKQAEIWAARKLFDTKNQEYINLLKVGWEGELGKELKDGFNLASENSHANILKLSHVHTSTVEKDPTGPGATIKDKFSFFDEPKNPNWFRSNTHWVILKIFTIFFQISDVIGEEVKQTEFYSKLKETQEKHKEFIKNNKASLILDSNLR